MDETFRVALKRFVSETPKTVGRRTKTGYFRNWDARACDKMAATRAAR